jgi:hypothetical protein
LWNTTLTVFMFEISPRCCAALRYSDYPLFCRAVNVVAAVYVNSTWLEAQFQRPGIDLQESVWALSDAERTQLGNLGRLILRRPPSLL